MSPQNERISFQMSHRVCYKHVSDQLLLLLDCDSLNFAKSLKEEGFGVRVNAWWNSYMLFQNLSLRVTKKMKFQKENKHMK